MASSEEIRARYGLGPVGSTTPPPIPSAPSTPSGSGNSAIRERYGLGAPVQTQQQDDGDDYGLGIFAAFRRGLERSFAMGDVAQGDYEELAGHYQNMKQWEMSQEDASKFEELRNTEGFWKKAGGLMKNPRLVMQVVAESLPMMAGPIAGAIGGGVAGGAIGTAMGAAPGAVGGTIAGSMTGGAVGSFFTEYFNAMGDYMQQQGVNPENPAQLKAAFEDDALMAGAKDFAFDRGVPIAAFDALSMGLAGRIAKPISSAVGKVTGGRRIGAGYAGEIAMQGGFGGAGEAGAQLASTGEIGDQLDVLLEAFAEVVPGIFEAGVSQYFDARKLKEKGLLDPDESPLAAMDKAEAQELPITATDVDPVTGEPVPRATEFVFDPETGEHVPISNVNEELGYPPGQDALEIQLEDGLADLKMTLEGQAMSKEAQIVAQERELEQQASRNSQMLELEAQRDAQIARQKRPPVSPDELSDIGEAEGIYKTALRNMKERLADGGRWTFEGEERVWRAFTPKEKLFLNNAIANTEEKLEQLRTVKEYELSRDERKAQQEAEAWAEHDTPAEALAGPSESEMTTPQKLAVDEEPIDVTGGQPTEAMRAGEEINPVGGRPLTGSLGEALLAAGLKPTGPEPPGTGPGGPFGPGGAGSPSKGPATTPPEIAPKPDARDTRAAESLAFEEEDRAEREAIQGEAGPATVEEDPSHPEIPFDPLPDSYLDALMREVQPGGGVAIVPDQNYQGGESDPRNDDGTAVVPTVRTSSTNPSWFQDIVANERVGMAYVENAIKRFKEGKRLGAKQKRIIEAMLGEIEYRNRVEPEPESDYIQPGTGDVPSLTEQAVAPEPEQGEQLDMMPEPTGIDAQATADRQRRQRERAAPGADTGVAGDMFTGTSDESIQAAELEASQTDIEDVEEAPATTDEVPPGMSLRDTESSDLDALADETEMLITKFEKEGETTGYDRTEIVAGIQKLKLHKHPRANELAEMMNDRQPDRTEEVTEDEFGGLSTRNANVMGEREVVEKASKGEEFQAAQSSWYTVEVETNDKGFIEVNLYKQEGVQTVLVETAELAGYQGIADKFINLSVAASDAHINAHELPRVGPAISMLTEDGKFVSVKGDVFPPSKNRVVLDEASKDKLKDDSDPTAWTMRKATSKMVFGTIAKAKSALDGWKAEAKRIGKTGANKNKVVISLFDATGTWSQPYVDAGYTVLRYDSARGDDIHNKDWFMEIEAIKEKGYEIVGVMAAPPCTSFSSAGAQWWGAQHDSPSKAWVEKKYGKLAALHYDKPIEYAEAIMTDVVAIVDLAQPTEFHAMENPSGRLRRMLKDGDWNQDIGLPSLSFDPWHFGDPYTKRTHLWGEMNTDLPQATVVPTEGSKMHKMHSGTETIGGERSATPEGFAYAFFMANHSVPGTTAPVAEPTPSDQEPFLYDIENDLEDVVRGIKEEFDLKSFEASIDDAGNIYVSDIEVPEGMRDQNRGSKAMRVLIEHADFNNQRIELEPSLSEVDLQPKEGLDRFYRRLGFLPDENMHGRYYRDPSSVQERMQPGEDVSYEKTPKIPLDAEGNPPNPVNSKPIDPATPMRERLICVACSMKKKDTPGRAIDVYDGPAMQTLRKSLEGVPEAEWPTIVILSGKHGVINGLSQIKPYDEKISKAKVDDILHRGLTEPPTNRTGQVVGMNILSGLFPSVEGVTVPTFSEVVISGSNQYRRAFNGLVWQLQQRGNVKNDASIQATSGGIGTQRGQLGKWIRQEGVPSTTPTIAEIEAAAAETNPAPTEAQIEAENYKKGRLKMAGFDIAIENAVGSVRYGNLKMKDVYGHFKKFKGADKDKLDVFVNPKAPEDFTGDVYVVDQYVDGKFDEHKVMLGYNNMLDARRAYKRNYNRGWKGLHNITKMSVEDFGTWAASLKNGTKQEAANATLADQKTREKDGKDLLYSSGKDLANAPTDSWIKTVLEGGEQKIGDVPDTVPLNIAVSELLNMQAQLKGEPETAAPAGPTLEEVKTAIQPIEDKLPGAPVTLLQNYRQAPTDVVNTMIAEEMTEVPAVFDPETGSIYMFADKIKSTDQGIRTAIHEKTHRGLREAFGTELDPLLNDIFENVSKTRQADMQKIADSYNLDPGKAQDRLVIAEELLTHMAENEPQSGIVKRAIGFIRKLLRKAGIVQKFTDNDLVAIIREAQGAISRRPTDQITGTMIEEEVVLADTGEVFIVEQDADVMLTGVNKRIKVCKKLRSCL